MASGLPCPNPACKHVFAVMEVQGATALTCPRCGGVFRFRAGKSTLSQAMPPVQAAPAAAKLAMPVDVELVGPIPPASSSPRAPLPGAGPGVAPPSASIVPASVLQRHRQRASGGWLSIVMASMVAAIAVGMILGGYLMFREEKHEITGKYVREIRPAAPAPALNDKARTPDQVERDGGTEQPLPTETFRGERSELDTPVGVWTKYKASDEDEQADLFLLGRDVKEKDDTGKRVKSATILVVVLAKSEGNLASAMRTVRDRIETQRQVENKNYKLVPASDCLPLESESVGDRRGQIVELKLESGGEPRKYLLLAVVQNQNAIYAIRCECNWEYRQIWQRDFRELLKSFRLQKKD